MVVPIYLDVFLSPIRDNQTAQVAVMAVLLLIVLDVLFGVGNAFMRHEFSSEKMREGIGHKCTELGFLLVGVIADGCIIGGVDLGYSAPVLTGAAVYICIMEIASLLELFIKINPALADSPVFKLLAASHLLKDKEFDYSGSED